MSKRSRDKGLYRLGLKFIELSGIFLNNLELKTEAQPYLQNLATLSHSGGLSRYPGRGGGCLH